jgi:hypothetical protein
MAATGLGALALAVTTAVAWDYIQEQRKMPPRGLPTGTVYMRIGPDTVPVGAAAPDFTLPKLRNGGEVRLAEYRGQRPVVLVFGSFSCNIFSRQILPLEQFYRRYQDRADFLFVNIREAGHPEDYLKPYYTDFPKDTDESVARRRERTLQLLAKLDITMPAVIDGSDYRTDKAYSGWPARIVVVAPDGKVVLNAGIDSAMYIDMKKFGDWLEEYLHTHPA